MASGPDAAIKITEAYARLVARDAYFWGWPMINIYNRHLAFKQVLEPGLMNGVLPVAPLNTLLPQARQRSPSRKRIYKGFICLTGLPAPSIYSEQPPSRPSWRNSTTEFSPTTNRRYSQPSPSWPTRASIMRSPIRCSSVLFQADMVTSTGYGCSCG